MSRTPIKHPFTITQKGRNVHIINNDLTITDAGTVTHQDFYAQDDKNPSGHEVTTEDQADMVVTYTYRLSDSFLITECVWDYKRQYGNRSAGTKEVSIVKYRRRAP